ncbi:hypothetical protein AMET1_0420 [Methanonatronarchaeum thermophilum]|uniref:Uncharacterized protein n=1 Tax=Methanonatronarchaeum thermophilum TaxID=1927129 RepID=A0A1Y3GBH4_9EURY|nr:hypothetical protein [Methanonatronarchaeum thermophilum]OUJ18769.1 hypothetical protein AMET1_0420 [Methanonatronarchaeum thermophilum]
MFKSSDKLKWRFPEIGSLDISEYPRESEFFKNTEKTEALVRESIQNSIDAKRKDTDTVEVTFTLATTDKNKVSPYIDELDRHLKSCKDINVDLKVFKESKFRFLNIEDFGTTGLSGEFSLDRPHSGSSEFYNFWRRKGYSEKKGQKGGRWGLGKTTFYMASDIRTFWGLTKRKEDNLSILMGSSVLQPHQVDGTRYQYNGSFLNKKDQPITDPKALSRFNETFNLIRDSEPGLSLVIPLFDDEIDVDSIIKSVIIHYFFPILRTDLKVKVFDERYSIEEEINSKTIHKNVKNVDWSSSTWDGKDIDKIIDFAEKAARAYEENPDEKEFKPQWGNSLNNEEDQDFQYIKNTSNSSISEEDFVDDIEDLRDSFKESKLLSFRVPVEIPLPDYNKKSYFDVFLKKYPKKVNVGEFYIRSGIILPEEKKRLGKRPVAGMLVADDELISTFLGDAEEPAHTKWNERTEGFRERYNKPIGTIRFIRNSMRDIAEVLRKSSSETFESLLNDVFYLTARENEEEKSEEKVDTVPEIEPDIDKQSEIVSKEKHTKPMTTNPTKIPSIPPSEKLFNISQIENGFYITYTGDNEYLPVEAEIKAAYDVDRGNPFNRYSKFDFKFSNDEIEIKISDGEKVNFENNSIHFKAIKKGFKLEITGFDPNRDLIIDLQEV